MLIYRWCKFVRADYVLDDLNDSGIPVVGHSWGIEIRALLLVCSKSQENLVLVWFFFSFFFHYAITYHAVRALLGEIPTLMRHRFQGFSCPSPILRKSVGKRLLTSSKQLSMAKNAKELWWPPHHVSACVYFALIRFSKSIQIFTCKNYEHNVPKPTLLFFVFSFQSSPTENLLRS